jgi:hypothetical protein
LKLRCQNSPSPPLDRKNCEHRPVYCIEPQENGGGRSEDQNHLLSERKVGEDRQNSSSIAVRITLVSFIALEEDRQIIDQTSES